MSKLSVTNDFKNIVLNDIKLIDVRALVEYEKGSIVNSVNLPILTNEERHIIGICYKEKGNEEATKLGHQLVSGKVKEERVNSWVKYFAENPNAMIYCFRGGSRSTIAQRWIYEETGKEITKLDGGYKAFRNYLITQLEPENIKPKPIVLTGYTGSGKTIIINKLNNSIDLEGLANHRGSAFGHFVTPQPSQIDFENKLAYEIIKKGEKGYKNIIFEDESKNIGRNYMPKSFYEHFHSGDVVFVDVNIEDRVENILKDYVIDGQKEHIMFSGDITLGFNAWKEDMLHSMEKVKNKLGGDRFKTVIEEFIKACESQEETASFEYHRNWIRLFLSDYYDPMYSYSLNKSNRNIIFKGNVEEVLQYLRELEK